MKAPVSAMAAGHSATPQKPAALHRNRLPSCSGLGCLLTTESGAFLKRILQVQLAAVQGSLHAQRHGPCIAQGKGILCDKA